MDMNMQSLTMHNFLMSSLNSCKKRYVDRMEDMCNKFHKSMEGLLEELVRDVLVDFMTNFGNHCDGLVHENQPILEEAAAVLETEHIVLGNAANSDDIQTPSGSWCSEEDKQLVCLPIPIIKTDEESPEISIVKEEMHDVGSNQCPDLEIVSPTEEAFEKTDSFTAPPPPRDPVPLSQEAEKLVWKVSNDCFRCRQCWREFRVRRYAEQHVRTHTGERPFACHLCGRPFTQRSTMYRHLREAHFRMRHSECPVCHKTFSRRLTMKRHMLTHGCEAILETMRK